LGAAPETHHSRALRNLELVGEALNDFNESMDQRDCGSAFLDVKEMTVDLYRAHMDIVDAGKPADLENRYKSVARKRAEAEAVFATRCVLRRPR